MNLEFKQASLKLEASQILTLDDSLNARIVCEEGTLWITQDGDPRDVVLIEDQSYMIDRTSRVVIFAVSASSIRLLSRPCAPVGLARVDDSLFGRWFSRPTSTLAAAAPFRL